MRTKQLWCFLTAVLVLLLFSFASYGEGRPFITRWKGKAGEELRIPINGDGYKLIIKKASDGSVLVTENDCNGTYRYTPTEDGELLVEAGPEGVRFIRMQEYGQELGSAEALLCVEQFGTVKWESMENAFRGCTNLQFSAGIDTPDLSKATDMSGMFAGCTAFNQPLDNWDVSKVTDMSFMFVNCTSFNQPLNNWDVSKVTNMNSMFSHCTSFNQELGMWKLERCQELGLDNCGMSVENYSKSLVGWAAQTNINQNLQLNAEGLKYNASGKAARKQLIEGKGWNIRRDSDENDRPFITRWKGEAGKELRIPINGYSYKLIIKKASDGSMLVTENDCIGTYRYTPTEDGELLVEAGPEGVSSIRMQEYGQELGSCEALLRVEQFGTVQWGSMKNAFFYCKNMDFAKGIDTPDVSQVTNMENMFCGCSAFNQPLNNWDVGLVTNMENMFYGCSAFNQPLNNWDVSKVTNMEDMFHGCTSFNQPLNNWDVSKVINMQRMFVGCTPFNQPLNNWDVSQVTNMGDMFSGCTSFNQSLNNWDVSKVTYMRDMFSGCTSFNQDLGMWKLESCQELGLEKCGMSVENYSKSLVGWAAQANITQGLRLGAGELRYNASAREARKQLVESKNWSISGDVDGKGLFITRWKGEAGETLGIPIRGENYKLLIRKSDGTVLKTATVLMTSTNAPYKFTPTEDGELLVEVEPEGVYSFEMRDRMEHSPEALLRVEQFGTVEWIGLSFSGCKNMQFAEGIDTPDLSKVTNMEAMFLGCTSFNQPLNNWDLSKVTNMGSMFSGCASFNQPLNSWDVSKVTAMWSMFHGCTSFNQPLNNWDVSQVTRMGDMFSGCTSFNQPLNNWDVSKVTAMWSMFSGCTSFNQPLNSWDVSKVTDMGSMFLGCASFNQPLNSWDVSKVTDMENMFSGCTSFNQPLNYWDVSQVAGMWYMFSGCTSFNQPLNSWDVSKVTAMRFMFSGCASFNQPLNNWDVSKVTDMENMFSGCTSFNQNLGMWELTNCRKLGLDNCCMSAENYSKSLEGWAAQNDINERLQLNATGLKFFSEAAKPRTKLINSKHWLISGDKLLRYYFSFEANTLSLIKGVEHALVLTKKGIDASETVTLISSDPNTVQIINAAFLTIKGLKEGTATITATVAANENHDVLNATCEVTVRVAVTGVSLSKRDLPLVKGATEMLIATVSPTDATNKKVIWSSNNSSVATVENGQVTAMSAGNATVTVTTEDGNHPATCEVVVTDPVPVTGVTLSQTELSLLKGTTATLVATVVPSNATNKKETWSSNNSSVATVENGTVIAVSGGNATITVTTEDGNHTATCEVVVTDLVPVTGVTLSQTELSLEKGETADLTATVSPADATNQKVTWSSNNTTVATVENGKVTAVSGGKATISVTTEDGNHTATCEVTVTEEDVVLTGLQLSPSETRLKVGGEATLSVSYEPAGASQREVTWSTSDAAIVTVDANGKIKGIAVGEATITVESKSNTSIKATCSVSVELPTAVVDAVFASVVISPNPFGAQLRIANGDLRGQYVLYNVQGVVVASGVLEASETRINTASFSAGTYLLRLTAENGATKTLTVVKD